MFGTHYGDIEVELADRGGPERFLLGLGALAIWSAAEAVPPQTPVECGARQVGQGRLRHPGHRRVEAILCGQLRETFLTRPDRSTPCRCRAGAPAESLSHQASRDGNAA